LVESETAQIGGGSKTDQIANDTAADGENSAVAVETLGSHPVVGFAEAGEGLGTFATAEEEGLFADGQHMFEQVGLLAGDSLVGNGGYATVGAAQAAGDFGKNVPSVRADINGVAPFREFDLEDFRHGRKV
jgi:hypothetical protein